MNMVKNRAGAIESAQISRMGKIVFDSDVYKMTYPSNIKNDGDEPVTLEVCLWNMSDDEFVETVFDVGWNPEIVKAIKKKNGTLNIKWGY